MKMLAITHADLQIIYKHCNEEYPNEACGILAGHDERVEQVHPMTNMEPGPCAFVMDPQEQFRVMNKIRQEGRDLVGIYHSHPESRAYPSSTDVRLSYYPEAAYVIVTLMNRNEPAIKGYTIVEENITEIPVHIMSEAV